VWSVQRIPRWYERGSKLFPFEFQWTSPLVLIEAPRYIMSSVFMFVRKPKYFHKLHHRMRMARSYLQTEVLKAFVCCLCTLSISRLHTRNVGWHIIDELEKNLEGNGRHLNELLTDIFLEGFWKTTQNLSQDTIFKLYTSRINNCSIKMTYKLAFLTISYLVKKNWLCLRRQVKIWIALRWVH
jgi:hypothetical protein